MTRIALAALALLLAACVPPDDGGDAGSAAPSTERPEPRRPTAPTRQKPTVAPKLPKESLQAGEYYRYVDESGRVRLAASLEEVPERQRSTAGRVSAPKQLREKVASASTRRPIEVADPGLSAHVVLYTTQSCPWCRKATMYLDSIGQDYVNWDVEQDPEKRDEYLALTNGRSGVPVIVVGNHWMQGWNQQKFDELLRAEALQ